MTKAPLRSVTACAFALVLSSVAARAADPPPSGSLDTWVEACEAADPDLQARLANEALLVTAAAIQQHPDGTFSILHQPFVQDASGRDLCPSSLFYDQAQVSGLPFRSAVQVGPDLLLTAWHEPFIPPHHVEDYVVVFGFQYRQVGDSCLPPTFENIPGDRLFHVVQVVADGHPGAPGGLDFLLLRLDRPVGVPYPRVRRTGRGWPEDSVTVISHPERIAAKVDLAGVAGETIVESGREALQVANVHLLVGSSGSMLYNRTQEVLETVANSGGSATFVPGGSTDPECYVIGHQDVWSELGSSLRYFARHIPAFELLVTSLDPVVNVTTVGGVLPNPSTSRTVKAPLTAAGPLAYQIVPPPPFEPGQPTLMITPAGPQQGTLAPGASFQVQEQAHIHGVGCGRYERSYEVHDLTNGFQDKARHVFEIGLHEFTVTDPDYRRLEDLALPFENTLAYTVHNPRPDPVTVIVTADQEWMTLNNITGDGAAPSITLQIGPGQNTVVTAGVGDLPKPETIPQDYDAVITFDFAPGTACPAFAQPITRDFKLSIGHEVFASTGGLIPPGPAAGLEVTVDVQEEFCVGDLDVGVRVNGPPATQIVATLTAPPPPEHDPPIHRILWNHGQLSSPTQPLIVTLDDEGDVHPFEWLSGFDDAKGRGIWRFKVVNDGPQQSAFLASWNLQFTAKPCP